MRLDIDKIKLASGAHAEGSGSACVMEAVAYVAREQWSDHPECVSPVIASFLRSWNDGMGDEDRQKLKALIPVVMDSVGTPDDEDRRAWMLLDWLVREYTPVWLRMAKLDVQADTLASLPRFKQGMDVPAIKPAIEVVRQDADAARAAAWAAARDAAWEAARAAAGAAAWAAARDAAWDAARDAAREAARAAAGAAAWAAARDAAWDAARDAARDALRPSVVALQESAMQLVERMVWLKDDDNDK